MGAGRVWFCWYRMLRRLAQPTPHPTYSRPSPSALQNKTSSTQHNHRAQLKTIHNKICTHNFRITTLTSFFQKSSRCRLRLETLWKAYQLTYFSLLYQICFNFLRYALVPETRKKQRTFGALRAHIANKHSTFSSLEAQRNLISNKSHSDSNLRICQKFLIARRWMRILLLCARNCVRSDD